MSSTDNHSGFRLPWQASHATAPDADAAGGARA